MTDKNKNISYKENMEGNVEDSEDMKENKNVEKIHDIKDDEIMTVFEVAAYFKISEMDALKLVEDGEIPAFRIAQHWRINKLELAKFMDTLKEKRQV